MNVSSPSCVEGGEFCAFMIMLPSDNGTSYLNGRRESRPSAYPQLSMPGSAIEGPIPFGIGAIDDSLC